MKYFIKTFGCQMNEAESEKLAGLFMAEGHEIVGDLSQAEVVVINTCSVRESAENRVLGLVNNLLRKESGSRPRVIVTGCMVGSAQKPRRRYTLAQLAQKLPGVELRPIEELLGKKQIKARRLRADRALVPIMRGCNHFCSYCVVPYSRGGEKSREFDEVVCEVERLVEEGYQEVLLLGQNVNSYGQDLNPVCSFGALLHRLHDIKNLKKTSFLTSNPWDLTDEIIEAISLPKVSRELHLAVQSGDDEVLKRMNRGYTAQQFLDLVKKIRRGVPDIRISTDIIVGFPGETKEAFERTVKLCREAGFERAFISRYSPRPGTKAAGFPDDVSPAEKKRRWRVLEELINQNGQKKR